MQTHARAQRRRHAHEGAGEMKNGGMGPAVDRIERAGQWKGKLSKQTTIERASGMFY